MLEKIMRSVVLGGSLLLSAGCVSFKPYDASKIVPVVPVVNYSGKVRDSFDGVSWVDAIRLVETPDQAKAYCRWLWGENRQQLGLLVYGFKDTHNGAPVECIEAVYACAALLGDNGYAPLLLGISNNSPTEGGHCVFVYRSADGLFGCGGFNQFDWVPARFESVNDVAKEVAHRLAGDGGQVYQYYDVFNIKECDPDFITRGPRFHTFVCTKKIE